MVIGPSEISLGTSDGPGEEEVRGVGRRRTCGGGRGRRQEADSARVLHAQPGEAARRPAERAALDDFLVVGGAGSLLAREVRLSAMVAARRLPQPVVGDSGRRRSASANRYAGVVARHFRRPLEEIASAVEKRRGRRAEEGVLTQQEGRIDRHRQVLGFGARSQHPQRAVMSVAVAMQTSHRHFSRGDSFRVVQVLSDARNHQLLSYRAGAHRTRAR